MPRSMPNGLVQLLARPDKRIVSHTTLQILIDTTDVKRSYYFATASLTVNNVQWLPHLRKGSKIRSSLTRASDSATVALQNADLALGVEMLKIRQYLYGADMLVGRYWKDLNSGFEFHKTFFTGVVAYAVPQIDEREVTIQGVSTAYTNVSVGATRRTNLLCSFPYKDPSTCNSKSALPDCNLMINNAGGCDTRHGSTHKRAANGGFVYLSSGNRLATV